MTRSLREDEELLSSLAAEFLRSQGETLSAAELAALPRSISLRALRLWLGGELSRTHLESVLALTGSGPSARVELPGLCVRREYDRLCRGEPRTPRLEERELPERGCLRTGSWEIKCEISVNCGEIQSSFNIFTFSCANICGKLTVAPRRTGDTIRLHGREGSRSVKKRMIEEKIPAHRREGIPVIRDEAGVLAVFGIGQAHRAFPRPGETVQIIEIKEIPGG